MKRLIPISTLAACLLLAGAAAAAVAVYKNGFNDRADFKAIERIAGGKECGKSWKGKKLLGVRTADGRRDCMYGTPVEGDSKQPDHTIQAVGKVGKQTDKKIRDSVYVGVALRVNRRSDYQLRIFPKGRRWQLIRSGDGIRAGRDGAIDKLGAKNKLRLVAEGSRITAKVNGQQLASFKDEQPDEVSGRKSAIVFGSTSKRNKKALGSFDQIRVLVPDP